ncbi:uncharacterized protein TRIVIDRAFT_129304, partial [Trichoderma virens Gv29-8]
NVNTTAWYNAAISIALDFWMLAILLCFQLEWRLKIGVGVIFRVRAWYVFLSFPLRSVLILFSVNIIDLFGIGLWSTLEINVGIICTCMPSLRLPLI